MTHAGAASGILESFTTVQAFVGLATISWVTFRQTHAEHEAAVDVAFGSGGGGGGAAADGAGPGESLVAAEPGPHGGGESSDGGGGGVGNATGMRLDVVGHYMACGDGEHLLAGALGGATRRGRGHARDPADLCAFNCNVS